MDKFKAINDNLGHDAGDELLKQAAERMQSCLRDSDTVARMGGDEFMVLLTDYPNQALVEDIAERLLFELARPFVIFGQDCQVSASIGLAFSSDTGDSSKALKKHADIALYQAKGAGRNPHRAVLRELTVFLVAGPR